MCVEGPARDPEHCLRGENQEPTQVGSDLLHKLKLGRPTFAPGKDRERRTSQLPTDLNLPDLTPRKWEMGMHYELLPGKLWFAPHEDESYTRKQIKQHPRTFYFSSILPETYQPFCADFGPLNLGIVHRFCEMLRQREQDDRLKKRKLVYYIHDDKIIRTNSVFMLGCYLMIHHNYTPMQCKTRFGSFPSSTFLKYRDATFCEPEFELSMYDCWCGLHKAIAHKWYSATAFDLKEYETWDHPLGGDMHQVGPKFIAFKGPVSSHARKAAHVHSPGTYLDEFARRGVTCVVRLNSAQYDAKEFTQEGFRHYDLFFEDCTVPSAAIIQQFLDICDRERCVAVHCYAGLGRTGTLIALWIMRNHAFSAREAIAWLRVVRPGSVIGPQQQFLQAVQSMEWRGNHLLLPPSLQPLPQPSSPVSRRGSLSSGAPPAGTSSRELAEEVTVAVNRRAAALTALHQGGKTHQRVRH